MKCSAAVDEKGSRELSAPFRHIRFLRLFTAERLVKSNRTQKTWDRASKELSNGVISFKCVKKWWSYINLNKSGMILAGKGLNILNYLRPNALADRIGLKRLYLDLFKSYPMTYWYFENGPFIVAIERPKAGFTVSTRPHGKRSQGGRCV
jgi:hypothetical protein